MPRPSGNKWINAECYIAYYCPKPLGGDHRVFFAMIGRKWVYLATGYGQRAKWTKTQWEAYLENMRSKDIIKRHGGREVIELLNQAKDTQKIPLLPRDLEEDIKKETPLKGQLQLI